MDKLLLTEWKLRALEGNVSRQFYCERGVVWITAGPRDITLRAGESWTQPVTAGWLQGAGAVDGGRVGVLGAGRGGASPILRIAALAGRLARQCRISGKRAAWPPAVCFSQAGGRPSGS